MKERTVSDNEWEELDDGLWDVMLEDDDDLYYGYEDDENGDPNLDPWDGRYHGEEELDTFESGE